MCDAASRVRALSSETPLGSDCGRTPGTRTQGPRTHVNHVDVVVVGQRLQHLADGGPDQLESQTRHAAAPEEKSEGRGGGGRRGSGWGGKTLSSSFFFRVLGTVGSSDARSRRIGKTHASTRISISLGEAAPWMYLHGLKQ